VNAERGALHSPEFKGKMVTTRRMVLEEISAYFTDKSKGISPKSSRKKGTKSAPISANKGGLKTETPKPGSQESKEESLHRLVNIGKEIISFISKKPSEFDGLPFTSLLQQIVQRTIGDEELVYGSKERDALIAHAKNIVRIGQQYAELQERQKVGGDVSGEKIQNLRDQLRQTLSQFFLAVKKAQNPETATNPAATPPAASNPMAISTHEKKSSGDFLEFNLSPPKVDSLGSMLYSKDDTEKPGETVEYDEREDAIQLDSLCEQVKQTAEEIKKTLQNPKFDSEYFIILLTLVGKQENKQKQKKSNEAFCSKHLLKFLSFFFFSSFSGRKTKELAEIAGADNSKGITDLAKVLLRKGILLKSEPEIYEQFRKEVIVTLDALINEITLTTEAIEKQVDTLIEELNV
jgi:hypothetical protein